MPTNTVNVEGIEPKFGAMHRLREALGSEAVGLTVVDCDPGWEGPEHDHTDGDHEEIYLLLEGSATVTIDGEAVALSPGDAVLVAPEETRQITNGDVESRLVLAGANR
jgi:quercetin dioxygenase-like cupin family protein